MLLSVFHYITYKGAYIAGVASVFVRFRSKERGTRVKDRMEMGRVKEPGGGGSRRQKPKIPAVPRRSSNRSCSETRRQRFLRR